MITQVENKFTNIRNLKNKDTLLNLHKDVVNIINKYYDMTNVGNYYEILKKYFYDNNVDEYNILLNLKDRIINMYKEDPYDDELLSLVDLLLYEDKENECIKFLINEIINYKIDTIILM